LFNPSEVIEVVTIRGEDISKIMLTNLYEEEKLEIQESIAVPPKGYITLKICSNKYHI
jgi:hypothetical protein